MENQSLLQSFAIDKDGRVRSVDEVSRGLACECTCPCCGEAVIARHGQVREWHFAHASGADCDGAAEGALHRAAKQVLIDSGGMTIPEVRVEATVTLPDGRTGRGEVRRPAAWIDFQSAEAEKDMGPVRPDVVAMVGPAVLFVEIAVSHFVDEDKRRTLEQLAIPTIEIDLGGVGREDWDWDTLRRVVVDGASHKEWVHLLDGDALEREAHDAASQAAWACPLPQAPVPPVQLNAPRMRFWVGRRMVDVVERPFGLAVWSPYDPELNEKIKSLVRTLGGQWQPKFKNWLVPPQARSHLLDGLTRLSGKAPERR